MTGATYSTGHYTLYQETKDKNIFEEIVDQMIIDQVPGMNDSFREKISLLDRDKKRMAILSLLDKDRNLFLKIKGLINKDINKMDHIKDVVSMLREYVKVGEVEKKKYGEVMTPLDFVKKQLNVLPKEVWSNPYLKWLDPANGTGPYPIMVIYKLMIGLKDWEPDDEKRYKHIVENMIHVCELQPKNMFLYMCSLDPFDTYKLNIYTGSFLEVGFDYHMKNVWDIEKFNIILGNPPFNQMIDMTFVQKSYSISDIILFIHPSTWLLDEKNKQKKFRDTKNLISEHLESIELFNGNKLFGIQLFVPCVITYINKNKKIKEINCLDTINDIDIKYDNIYQINKFSDLEIYHSIKEKIKSKIKESLYSRLRTQSDNTYYINLSQIRGHVDLNSTKKMLKDDFYTLCTKNLVVSETKRQQRELTQFSFLDKSEANNFLKYTKTNFARFCLSLNKNNQNLYCGEMSFIPWLDFSQEWTDEKLYKYFDISEEEIKFIEKQIPKYY
jgi:hypothetical protein